MCGGWSGSFFVLEIVGVLHGKRRTVRAEFWRSGRSSGRKKRGFRSYTIEDGIARCSGSSQDTIWEDIIEGRERFPES